MKGFKGLKHSQSSRAYGDYINHVQKGSPTDPVEQRRAAQNSIAEMKGRATTDHTWELLGHRHKDLTQDLEWTKLAHAGEERRRQVGAPNYRELLKLQESPPRAKAYGEV